MKLWKIMESLNEANSLGRIFDTAGKLYFHITIDDKEEIDCENKTQFYLKLHDLGYMTETAIEIINRDIKNYKCNPITIEFGRTIIKVELRHKNRRGK